MEFLKIILIILLVYFGIKFLAKLLGPYIFKFIMKKAGKQFEKQFSQFQQPTQPKKEGEITINKVPKNKRSAKNDVGEYVEYEEVKE